MSEIARAAALLAESRLAHRRFDRLPKELAPPDEGAAYRVQEAVHAHLTAAGAGPLVGHKIGCTTPVMQEYLGIANPCAGRLFAPTVHFGAGTFAHHGDVRIGVECEIAVWLGADLPPRPDVAYAREDVRGAVDACMAAIEVVEDRYVDYPSLDTPMLIADDFFNAGAVLGPRVEGFELDALPDVTARMLIDGVEVGRGVGSDVMAHPLDALAWLASSASARGLTLAAGEFVLLGSLVQTHWVTPGATVQIVNDQLGAASARFP
jgi:2-keto-4-pentenoate hydratase